MKKRSKRYKELQKKSVKNKKDSCFINVNSDDIFSDGSIKYIQKYFKIKI